MSVDTTCHKSLVSGKEIRKICHFPNDVFRIKKGLKSTVSKIFFTKEQKFVIKLYVFYNVPTCQAHGIYCF